MKKTNIVAGLAGLCFTGAGATAALAQSTDDTGAAAPPSMITPQGKIKVDVSIGVGLSKDNSGKPIAIAPDIFYGVMPKLEVGLAHSGYALDGFWGDTTLLGIVGTGVCVSGDDGGCASVYNGPVAVLGRYALIEDDTMAIAADVGPEIRALDSNGSADGGDMLLGFKVGIRGHKQFGKVGVGFAPSINLGLNQRDGNGDFLAVPVEAMFMVNDKLGVGLQTGIEGDLDQFGDNFALPIALGGMYGVNENISAGAAFVLHRVTGGTPEGVTGPDAADLRSLQLFVSWHN